MPPAVQTRPELFHTRLKPPLTSAPSKEKAVPSTWRVSDPAAAVRLVSRSRRSVPPVSRTLAMAKSVSPRVKSSSDSTAASLQLPAVGELSQPRTLEPRSWTVRVPDQTSASTVSGEVLAKAVSEGSEVPAELMADTR